MKHNALYISMLLTFTLNANRVAAQNYTISGYITDRTTGETLLSATVFERISGKGSITNNYGYYSLTLPAGEVSLDYSYVGFQTEERSFTLHNDTVLPISLAESNLLQELTVIGNRSEMGVRGTQMSAVEIPVTQIKNIPTLFGENDLIKALQLLPGVQSGTEGSAGMYVRGGGPDENLLLLDGVPLYNVNHMLGFFSVFNSDALKNVTLYKGSFPARFGGRLSSVIDVRMKDGDDKKIRGMASIGLISSKIQMEGPIVREQTTFNVSLRRTYLDLLAQPVIRLASSGSDTHIRGAGYYFYDVNAKLTHKISDRDKLDLSTYLGDDVVYYNTENKNSAYSYEENSSTGLQTSVTSREYTNVNWDWGNAVAALRWNHIVHSKLFMNTTASFTRYRSSLGSLEGSELTPNNDPSGNDKNESIITYRSGINDWTLKSAFDYTPNYNHDIKFGAGYTYHTFRPDVTSMKIDHSDMVEQPIDTVVGSPRVYAHETVSFLEDNVSIGNRIKLNAGIHFSSFHVQKENYYSLQPRFGIRLMINDHLSAKAGYALMSQYIHMLSSSSISLPTDLWVPSTKKIPPMRSHQYSAGLYYSLKNIADFSVEGYYKQMNNLLEYKEGASFMGISTNWEEKVSLGRGETYGVELLLQRSFGNTTGWVGYTWAKSDRSFDRPGHMLNNGRPFPSKYDRRHDFSVTGMHKFSDKIDVSASWVFSTGQAVTLGFHEYASADSPSYDYGIYRPVTYPYISSRNNFRYNNYHRLDLGINFHKITRRGNQRTWNISLYNAYCRMNPFHVSVWNESYIDPESGTEKSKRVLKQETLFPIIPSVSYTIKF